ncbi:hypothetical protein C0J52_26846 [Blattella germanica]|nr:hypothetical protein C0J52_26846 [Blattella germanica]
MTVSQVVVPKRTALLLDRIMVALQKAVEEEKGGGRNYAPDLAESKVQSQNLPDELNEIPGKDSRPREFDPRIFRIRGRQLENEANNMI